MKSFQYVWYWVGIGWKDIMPNTWLHDMPTKYNHFFIWSRKLNLLQLQILSNFMLLSKCWTVVFMAKVPFYISNIQVHSRQFKSNTKRVGYVKRARSHGHIYIDIYGCKNFCICLWFWSFARACYVCRHGDLNCFYQIHWNLNTKRWKYTFEVYFLL